MAEGSALSDGKEAASRAATGRTTESGRAARRESPVRVAARRARAPDAWSSGAPSAGRGCHLGRLALKERVRLGPEDSDLDSVSIKGRLIELRRAGPFWHRHSGGHHRGARPCERSWRPDYGSRCRGRGLPSPRAATRRGGWGGVTGTHAGSQCRYVPSGSQDRPRRKVLVHSVSLRYVRTTGCILASSLKVSFAVHWVVMTWSGSRPGPARPRWPANL